ncbi:hypothetical protein AVEN_23857-1 [Araneus ventricosus]|uniref:Uncharacterized protein n=1 Tax=Araneus ventricosus TaxID=182803 RepID=A0A4Y2TFK3_ARAVE|nr:hypothetical protein AVEN_23857-1 [Araneus ventricosus]
MECYRESERVWSSLSQNAIGCLVKPALQVINLLTVTVSLWCQQKLEFLMQTVMRRIRRSSLSVVVHVRLDPGVLETVLSRDHCSQQSCIVDKPCFTIVRRKSGFS